MPLEVLACDSYTLNVRKDSKGQTIGCFVSAQEGDYFPIEKLIIELNMGLEVLKSIQEQGNETTPLPKAQQSR